MDILAFASFGVLVLVWIVAPNTSEKVPATRKIETQETITAAA